jgi:hypothetical protein
MEREEPSPRDQEPGATEETLRRLEQRLAKASQAAERLIAEAARSATRSPEDEPAGDAGLSTGDPPAKPPPAGWQLPGAEESTERGRTDLELLSQVLRSVRDLVPAELQQRLGEALREVLLALRALIDWYVERLERRRTEPVEVEDIPIR